MDGSRMVLWTALVAAAWVTAATHVDAAITFHSPNEGQHFAPEECPGVPCTADVPFSVDVAVDSPLRELRLEVEGHSGHLFCFVQSLPDPDDNDQNCPEDGGRFDATERVREGTWLARAIARTDAGEETATVKVVVDESGPRPGPVVLERVEPIEGAPPILVREDDGRTPPVVLRTDATTVRLIGQNLHDNNFLEVFLVPVPPIDENLDPGSGLPMPPRSAPPAWCPYPAEKVAAGIDANGASFLEVRMPELPERTPTTCIEGSLTGTGETFGIRWRWVVVDPFVRPERVRVSEAIPDPRSSPAGRPPYFRVVKAPYPYIDGFSFPNQGNPHRFPEFLTTYGFNAYLCVGLFGACASHVPDPLYWIGWWWLYKEWIPSRSCNGIAAASARMSRGSLDTEDFNPLVHYPVGFQDLRSDEGGADDLPEDDKDVSRSTWDLPCTSQFFCPWVEKNLWATIRRYHGAQMSLEYLGIFAKTFGESIFPGDFNQIAFEKIVANPTGHVACFFRAKKGHCVTPYAAQYTPEDPRVFGRIWVYDNNAPRDVNPVKAVDHWVGGDCDRPCNDDVGCCETADDCCTPEFVKFGLCTEVNAQCNEAGGVCIVQCHQDTGRVCNVDADCCPTEGDCCTPDAVGGGSCTSVNARCSEPGGLCVTSCGEETPCPTCGADAVCTTLAFEGTPPVAQGQPRYIDILRCESDPRHGCGFDYPARRLIDEKVPNNSTDDTAGVMAIPLSIWNDHVHMLGLTLDELLSLSLTMFYVFGDAEGDITTPDGGRWGSNDDGTFTGLIPEPGSQAFAVSPYDVPDEEAPPSPVVMPLAEALERGPATVQVKARGGPYGFASGGGGHLLLLETRHAQAGDRDLIQLGHAAERLASMDFTPQRDAPGVVPKVGLEIGDEESAYVQWLGLDVPAGRRVGFDADLASRAVGYRNDTGGPTHHTLSVDHGSGSAGTFGRMLYGPFDVPAGAAHRVTFAGWPDVAEVVSELDGDRDGVPDRTEVVAGRPAPFPADPDVEADLAVAKSPRSSVVQLGGSLTYDVAVTNHGPAAADGVELVDTPPAGAVVLSVVPSQGACDGAPGGIGCALGMLAAGATATVTVTVTPERPGTLANAAMAFATQGDPNLTNNGAIAAADVPAAIDVLPGNPVNPVHPGRGGVLPVAILGFAGFDVARIDVGTLTFGPGGAPARDRGRLRDVDGDGTDDLVVHFELDAAGLPADATEACVTGDTADLRPFAGCDAITIAPVRRGP